MKDVNLDRHDYADFRDWLNLDLQAITWQGRYLNEFEDFWSSFFIEGLSFEQTIQRFNYAYRESKIGPLASWFSWLKEKFISYIFLKKELSILEISNKSGLEVSEISAILRNFFLEFVPHEEDLLSDNFQIVHPMNPKVNLTFKELGTLIDIPEIKTGTGEEEIMPSLEVTLYEEWGNFIEKMKKEIYNPSFDFKGMKNKANFIEQWKILRDVVALVTVVFVLFLSIKYANQFYENYIVEKIGIYEPQFKWLDKTLTFKEPTKVTTGSEEKFSLDVQDLDEVDDTKETLPKVEQDRFDVESEVVLTSWDSLPKNFNSADFEKSAYEELLRRGYRESRYGNTKVYRVMMRSPNLITTKSKLNILLNKYDVTQVDKVKPGQFVPGGIYYNIFVPRLHLKEFMAQVMNQNESILYESRATTLQNPPGKNRVFIWVKDI